MNREALTQAIRVLQTVDPDTFDMDHYRSECGTVACIAGHCALDPWFQMQGFTLRNSRPYVPLYERYEGRRAIEIFFELNRAETSLVFYASRRETPTTQDAVGSLMRLLAK